MEIGLIKVEIDLTAIGINNDNDYLLKEIDSVVEYEQQGNKLYFYPEVSRELAYIDMYLRDLMILASFKEGVTINAG